MAASAPLAPTYMPTNSGTAYNATVFGNVVNSNQPVAITSGTRYQRGATISSYSPDIGGSVANTADMPPGGNEIWSNQKRPVVVIESKQGNSYMVPTNNLQNCTETNMIAALSSFQSR